MVDVDTVIKELEEISMVKTDRLSDEIIAMEEQDPSTVATVGEIIILLNEFKNCQEKIKSYEKELMTMINFEKENYEATGSFATQHSLECLRHVHNKANGWDFETGCAEEMMYNEKENKKWGN